MILLEYFFYLCTISFWNFFFALIPLVIAWEVLPRIPRGQDRYNESRSFLSVMLMITLDYSDFHNVLSGIRDTRADFPYFPHLSKCSGLHSVSPLEEFFQRYLQIFFQGFFQKLLQGIPRKKFLQRLLKQFCSFGAL